ncbi:MAG: cory-CC-star protein, partial [Gemmatimonadota bacterium]
VGAAAGLPSRRERRSAVRFGADHGWKGGGSVVQRSIRKGRVPDSLTGEDRDRIAARRSAVWAQLRFRLRAAKEIYEGIYFAPYRSIIHREYLRQRDLFMLLGISDMLGVPSPVSFYTLELLPDLIDGFHDWHLRLGLEQPPEGGFRCC